MLIKDLKTGSHIKLFVGIGDNGPEYRNETVSGIKSDYDDRIRIENSNYWHPLENFGGIELSEDILKKLGFTRLNSFYWQRNGGGFIVGYDVDGNMVVSNSFGARHCHYYSVHEIQNIWYAVTGEWLSLA